MNEEVMINVENLVKAYPLYDSNWDQLKELLTFEKKKYHRDFKALDGISFEVFKGEHIGIIGTNGSGKSTLLKILTGVVNPTYGNVSVNGKISALLELGAGFNPNYTGLQNIYLNGTIMGYEQEQIEKKVEDIVAFADIGDFINQPVKNYSSGMFARLAFAVAINVEPDILIVDEALSVGDTFFQNKCFRKFEELKNKGVTILFVSHDIESIRQMCSRVLWLEKGKMQMIGERNEVCNEYFNAKMRIINSEGTCHGKDRLCKGKKEKYYIAKRTFPKTGDLLSDDVEIVSAVVFNDSNQYVSTIQGGEKYKIEIVSHAKRTLSNIIIGFSFADRKGLEFLSYNTYSDSKETCSLEKDCYVKTSFEFIMPFIRKGPYLLNVAIARGRQEEHQILTWLHGVNEYEVTWKGYDLSYVKIPYKTEIEKIDEVVYE